MDDAAYLRAICWAPFDDGPRLVYADRLYERGECAWAEFIRVQVALAANPGLEHCTEASANWCPACGDCRCPEPEESKCDEACPLHRPDSPHGEYAELRRRERELLREYWWRWNPAAVPYPSTCANFGRPPVPAPAVTLEFCRGFVGSVTLTCRQFFGGPCKPCEGTGDVGWRNASGTCFDCFGTGRAKGLAAALFRAAPVTEVRLSDREPLRIFDGWVLSRGSGGPEMTRHVIPPEVFDSIPAVRGGPDERPEAGWIRSRNVVTDAPEELLFLTPDRAHAALSAAAVALGRRLAGLPELPRAAVPVPRGTLS
jgi:uncharacterized protein (TIGR02996 family)